MAAQYIAIGDRAVRVLLHDLDDGGVGDDITSTIDDIAVDISE